MLAPPRDDTVPQPQHRFIDEWNKSIEVRATPDKETDADGGKQMVIAESPR